MTRSQKGMTLVEVIIATLIFSMIMIGTMSALRAFAGTYARLQENTTRTTQMREVARFLRLAVTDALNGPGLFEGRESSLEWVAPIDRVGGAGGLQHLRLRLQRGRMILSLAPLRSSDEKPDWGSQIRDFPLLHNLEALNFFYRLEPQDDWSERFESGAQKAGGALPSTIAIEIVTKQKSWPPLIIALDQFRPGSDL